MQISKLCCIGGICESFIFADIFQKRMHSPTDGMASRNFRSLINVFDNSLFDAVLNDDMLKCEINQYRQFYKSDEDFLKTHDDFNLRYYCENNGDWSWRSGHTNFILQKRKDEFIKRINAFNEFKNEVQTNDNCYYLYAVSEFENTLTEQDFEYTCNNLPSYVIDKLIVLGATRNPINDLFNKNFRCITYNLNLGGIDNINKLWGM